MKSATSILVFAILLAYVIDTNALSSHRYECPKDCHCYTASVSSINWVTDCSESDLDYIPVEELDIDSYTLNMNGNRLKEINPFPANIRIRTLHLSDNHLTTITPSTFAGLAYLIEIDLSSNSISYISSEAFVGSAGLMKLELQGNPLIEVNWPFLNSKSLRYLNLKNCYFSYLSPFFFYNIRGLNKLDLSENPISSIESDLFNRLTSLQYLILNDCSLSVISSEAFDKLDYLKHLELAGNNLANVDWHRILRHLVRLEYLDLRLSGLLSLPKNTFTHNTWLRTLLLNENQLSHIDVRITLSRNLINMDYLDLSHCNIDILEYSFVNATKLRTLILSGNRISSIEVLWPLMKLEKLSLKDCGLAEMPINMFYGNTNIKELDISRNPLQNVVPELLSPLKSLEYLDMGYISLGNLSSTTFLNSPSLKTLILSGNQFNSLPSGIFQNLSSLEVLELNYCGIEFLKDSIFHDTFPKLEELRLSGNPIKVPYLETLLPPQLSGLKKVDLSNCNINDLPEYAFISTPNIKQLLLNNNRFDGTESSFKFLDYLRALEHLDLSSNKLTVIRPSTFNFNIQLKSLNLIDNQWKCDCTTCDMWNWAVSKIVRDQVALVGSRKSMDKYIDNKKKKYLVCDFDPMSSPTKEVYLKRVGGEFTKKGQRMWARYVQVANCP